MSWIEVHQSLQRHPKLLRLSAKLRVHRAQSAGHLLFLWLWSLDYAPTGDLSAFGPAEITAAAEYPGDAEIFAQALRDTGWIETDGMIHDWFDYAGKLIEKRKADKERKAEERKNHPKDVHGTSDGRRSDGAGTLPDLTKPNQVRSRARKSGEEEIPPEIRQLYGFWCKRFPASSRKADAVMWIGRRIASHGIERLAMAIHRYRIDANTKETETRYLKDCANFFGKDAAYEKFLPPDDWYAENLEKAQADLKGVA